MRSSSPTRSTPGLVNRIRLAGGVPRHVRCTPTAGRLGHRPGRARRSRRSTHGGSAADGAGDADRRLAGQPALRGACRTRRTTRRLGHLQRGHGTHPVRRLAAGAPGVASGPARPDDHRRLGVQRTADDRLAGRLGGGPAGHHGRRHPGRHGATWCARWASPSKPSPQRWQHPMRRRTWRPRRPSGRRAAS